ncbi:hypothetical protein TNCV_21651 [Trichonephila clavipes]|nr:hypothetical protein TNCV_21651 [Trichonephila clavipes]
MIQLEYVICEKHKKRISQNQSAIVAVCLRLEIWHSKIVTISWYHLMEEMRWRAIKRIDAVKSQIEVAGWLDVSPSLVCRLWQQFITPIRQIGGSAKDSHVLPRMPMTNIFHYAREGIKNHNSD